MTILSNTCGILVNIHIGLVIGIGYLISANQIIDKMSYQCISIACKQRFCQQAAPHLLDTWSIINYLLVFTGHAKIAGVPIISVFPLLCWLRPIRICKFCFHCSRQWIARPRKSKANRKNKTCNELLCVFYTSKHFHNMTSKPQSISLGSHQLFSPHCRLIIFLPTLTNAPKIKVYSEVANLSFPAWSK